MSKPIVLGFELRCSRSEVGKCPLRLKKREAKWNPH
jgi:hypothetical protein